MPWHLKLSDCPVCGGTAVVAFGKYPRFLESRSTGWPTPMGYTARCNFANCSAPTYTRSTAELAAEAWNFGVDRLSAAMAKDSTL